MQLIWYNPDLGEYQYGELSEFRSLKLNSDNSPEFQLLYKFTKRSQEIANRVILKLNQATRRKKRAWVD